MNYNFSPILAGTMLWGQWGRKLSPLEMADLINFCVAQGITTFDHADIYGGYTTEESFGQALRISGMPRKDIQLISKCGIKMISDNKPYRIGHYDYGKAYIIASCEKSLKNLQTDYLDLFLMHRPSPLMQAEEIAEACLLLKAQGKITSFGLSNFTPSQTELIRQYIPVEYNQIEFSLSHHWPLTDGALDYMKLHQIRPMAWAPLGNVFKADNQENRRIRKVLGVLSKKYKSDEDTLLLNWVLRHPAKVIPVAGTADRDRISRLKNAATFEMEKEDWFELWVAAMGHPVP